MKKLLRLYLFLPAVVMLTLVFYPFVVNMFVSNTELLDNRPLNKKPTALTKDFAKEYEAYYNDTFAGRKKLLKRLTKLKLKLKFDSGTTIHGLNDWLFYDSGRVPDGFTLIDYFGRVQFEDEELRRMASGIKKARDYYKKRGTEYFIIIAPNKENLYAEFMPEHLQNDRVSSESRMDRAVKYLQQHTDVNVLNFKDVLFPLKDKFGVTLYYPKDSHWNSVGAYLAFAELSQVMKKSGIKNIPIVPLRKSMIELTGIYETDLDKIAKHKDADYKVSYLEGKDGKCLKNEDNGMFHVYENPQAPVNKTVLMIRDSFGIALMPYFNKTFTKTVFAHNKFNKRRELERLYTEYEPDIVIDELVERYFDRFLKYNELYGE